MKIGFLVFSLIAVIHTCQAQTATPATRYKLKEPEMVFVEGGMYTMGSIRESAGEFGVTTGTHKAIVSDFSIGKYEVTQAEWQSVMGDSLNNSLHAGCGNCPVEEVSWNDVQFYIEKLNRLTGRFYQLPTQAQWEYAARGGKKSRGYKYAGSDNINEVALLGGTFTGRTQPVGSKRPNELGIYDMTGNVAEWCKDRPKPSARGYNIRGGSWGVHAEECKIAKDGSIGYPNDRSAKVGFRLVLIPYIPQPKCFNGDTVQYANCLIGRWPQYIDKPFSFLLNDLELPLKSFSNDDRFSTLGVSTAFAFYDIHTTNTILADLRAHRRRSHIGKIIFITITWKTPLPLNIVEDLQKTSGGRMTPAVQAYLGQQVIKDINFKHIAYIGDVKKP